MDTAVNVTLSVNFTITRDWYPFEERLNDFFSTPGNTAAVVIVTVALLSNILSLIAIGNTHGKLTSHFRLLVSLAIADIFVAISTLLYLTSPVLFLSLDRCSIIVLKALNTVGLNVTLANLMAMALDHYIAILRPLHHANTMSKRNTSILIAILWILAFVAGFSDFLSPIWEHSNYMQWRSKLGFCEFVRRSKYQEEYTVFFVAGICFIVMIFMYTRIYFRVWRHQRSRSIQAQRLMSKKTLVTTMLIMCSFVACWLPLCLFNITLMIIFNDKAKVDALSQQNLYSLKTKEKHLLNFMLFNGVCDPFIYAVRIREIQNGYLNAFRRCCGRFTKRQRSLSGSNSRSPPTINLKNTRSSYLDGSTEGRTTSLHSIHVAPVLECQTEV